MANSESRATPGLPDIIYTKSMVFFFLNMIDGGFGFSSAISDETHPRKKKRDTVALSQFMLHCYNMHLEESSFSEKYFVFLASVNRVISLSKGWPLVSPHITTYPGLTDTSVIWLSCNWIWQMQAI